MSVLFFWKKAEVPASAQSRSLSVLTQPGAPIAPTWEMVPTFNGGDIFSASSHGNALADAVNTLLSLYHTHDLLWPSNSWSTRTWGKSVTGEWYLIWIGQIRHQTDTLEYGVEVTSDSVMDCEVKISVGDLQTSFIVAGGGATTTQTGTIDVSSLQIGEFYEVRVEARSLSGGTPNWYRGTNDVRPIYIRETNAQTYATLHRFYSGDTPSASDWQLLSMEAAQVYDQLMAPRNTFAGYSRHVVQSTATVWVGTMRHMNRYLYYDIRMRPSYNSGDLYAHIYVNSNLVLTLHVTDSDRFRKPEPQEPDGEKDWTRFEGAIDLDPYGLIFGSEYKVEVTSTHVSSDGDDFSETRVLLLYEQQASLPSLSGWSTMPIFSRGDTIDGAGSMKAIRDNIEWLTNNVVYCNNATMRRVDANVLIMPPLWMVRYHRWLHYRWEPDDPDSDPPPELGYTYQSKWQTVNIPSEPNKWLSVDLDSINGLFIGSRYRIANVAYALESPNA